MSNFHILTQDGQKKSARVVFHFATPAGSNSAGVTWADAVVKEQGGAAAIASVLPDITTEEDSALKAGTLMERTPIVKFSSINLTNIQRLNEVRAAYSEMLAEIQAEKQITLDFMGYQGDV